MTTVQLSIFGNAFCGIFN